jgi:hypothetical protein
MLNYYLRFLPHAVSHQAPLHDVLSGPKVKSSHSNTQIPELLKPFEECKASLPWSTLLAHLGSSTPLALVTDASMAALDTVLQQCIQNAWQPLNFYPKKINPEVKPPPPWLLTQPRPRYYMLRHHHPSHELHTPDATYISLLTSTAEQPANAKQRLGKQPLLRKAYKNMDSDLFSVRPDSRLYKKI